jgi:Lrp/AsnC family leucine-responsive transcriptional regulator
MDAIDSEILRILADDARISFSALGRSIGLSTNAAAARVRKLESSGVIAGYRVVLADDAPDSTRARGALEAFIDVRLDLAASSDAFLEQAKRMPAVRDAVHVTGSFDYLLHIVVQDTSELDRFLRSLKNDAGVAQTQTRLALR